MAGPDESEPESSSSGGRDTGVRAARWGALAAVLAALVTGLFSLWAATIDKDDTPRRPAAESSETETSPALSTHSSAPPAAGGKDDAGIPVGEPVGIHPRASADLCLTEGRTPSFDSQVATQQRCDDANLPDVSLERAGGGHTYRIVWDKVGEGRGCLGPVPDSGAEGMLQPLEACDNATRFELERLASGGPGYRFHEHGGDRCIDVGEGSQEGVAAVMRPCSGGAGQKFTIDPV